MRPVIHSEKHIIQRTLETTTAGAISTEEIMVAVDTVGSTNTDVAVGAVVKAILIEMWVRGQDTSAGSFVACLIKLPSGFGAPSAANMANLNDYQNKNNIFYMTQGLLDVTTGEARMVTPPIIKIPKGKQRMSLGDKWIWVNFAQALDNNQCGKFIFKEYL